MTLLALQTEFRDWLKIGSEEQAERFPTAVRSGLDIYQNNYRAQLATCLEESFPVTLAWLGGEAFHAAVVAHVAAVPPSSWTLDHYPREFPTTVRNLYPDDPELTDLTVLEQALGEAFVATNTLRRAIDLASVDWDHAQFEFVSSLATYKLSTNALEIWSAIIAGATPPSAMDLPERGAMMVWRADETCRFRSISQGEQEALSCLSTSGTTFGGFCNARPAQVNEIGRWLGQWIADGIIAEISAG